VRELKQWVILGGIYISLVLILFNVTLLIQGPFIFNDEAEYHWLSSEIYHFGRLYSHQYGPLYPLLISPTFFFEDSQIHFYLVKLINILVYSSGVFPLYLLSRKILASNSWAILIALVGILGPISAYSHLVWADPLYYTLIFWSYFYFIKYLESRTIRDIFYSGIFIGFGFLAKQAAILLPIAYCFYFIYEKIAKRQKLDNKAILFLAFGLMVVISGWIIRNAVVGESVVGYSSMFSLLLSEVKQNPIGITMEFIRGLSYSIGYWVFVYLGCCFLLLQVIANQNKFQIDDKKAYLVVSLAIVVVIHLLILMTLSQVFLVAYGKMAAANGRYVDVVYPLALIVIAWMVVQERRESKSFLVITALICFIWLLFFSPLNQVEAYGAVNNSGTSILNLIFWPGQFLWSIPEATLNQRLIIAGVVTSIFILILILHKFSIWLILSSILILGLGAQIQVKSLGETANPMASIFLEIDKRNIPNDSLVFDTELGEVIMTFHAKFWHPVDFSKIKFIDPLHYIQQIPFNFSEKHSAIGDREINIWAPWNLESAYREMWGLGFNDITTLNASKCPLIQNQGDFVLDKKALDFKLHLPAGKYILTGQSADTECLGIKTAFALRVQNGPAIELKGRSKFTESFEVNDNKSALIMSMIPLAGSVWSLDSIIIEQANKKDDFENISAEYLLSKRRLPLSQIFSVGDYRLYKIQAPVKTK
jgi:hypothetical protein